MKLNAPLGGPEEKQRRGSTLLVDEFGNSVVVEGNVTVVGQLDSRTMDGFTSGGGGVHRAKAEAQRMTDAAGSAEKEEGKVHEGKIHDLAGAGGACKSAGDGASESTSESTSRSTAVGSSIASPLSLLSLSSSADGLSMREDDTASADNASAGPMSNAGLMSSAGPLSSARVLAPGSMLSPIDQKPPPQERRELEI
jgi:hypothetical protein